MMLGIAAFSPAMLTAVVGHVGMGGEMASVVHQNLQRHSFMTIINFSDRMRGLNQTGRSIGTNLRGIIFRR